MTRHVIQGKVGLMPAGESWAELPRDPSSQVSLSLTFKPFFLLSQPLTPLLAGQLQFLDCIWLGPFKSGLRK